LPLAIRGIGSDTSMAAEDKLEAIKWLNELTHRIQNIISEFNTSSENNMVSSLVENITFLGQQNETAKAEIDGIVKLAYEKTNRTPENTFRDYSTAFLVFHQALNEVCHGTYALPEWEFATLMGITKKEAVKILNSEKDLWANNDDQ
jgi:hypothetical protein